MQRLRDTIVGQALREVPAAGVETQLSASLDRLCLTMDRTLPKNAFHRWIIDSATDFAIIATDRSGSVTAWNEGARLILGWCEEEMIGQTAERMFTPEDNAAGRAQTEMHEALTVGMGNDERWHRRKSGERFWATGQMTVLRDDADAPIGFVKVLRDRTEQKLATEGLRGSQSNIRLLLDAMIEGFYAVDTEGVTTLCNAAFLRMMGFAREEDAVGRKLHDVIHHHHRDGSPYAVADCPIYVCAKNGTHAQVRDELFFPVDGSPPLIVDYQVIPIISGGEHRGAICTFVSVTEERNASERLKLALDAGAIVGTWVWDVPADTVIADERLAKSFGLSPDLCRSGLPIDQFTASIHEDDRARVRETIERHLPAAGPTAANIACCSMTASIGGSKPADRSNSMATAGPCVSRGSCWTSAPAARRKRSGTG